MTTTGDSGRRRICATAPIDSPPVGVTGSPTSPTMSTARFALLGFFLAVGEFAGSAARFRLRDEAEISFFLEQAAAAEFPVTTRSRSYSDVSADEDFFLAAKKCAADDSANGIPREVLDASPESLDALHAGLFAPHSSTGERTLTTTSPVLAGQLQETALKGGQVAVVSQSDDGRRWRVAMRPADQAPIPASARPPRHNDGRSPSSTIAGGSTASPFRMERCTSAATASRCGAGTARSSTTR